MNRSQEHIANWIIEGQSRNARYLIVIYDASNGNYFPDYVMEDENLEQRQAAFSVDYYTEVAVFDL